MSEKDNGGPAFPSHGSMGEVSQEGMTLRDYFAAKAPECPDEHISLQERLDHNKNPHNDHYKPKLRSTFEIIADWSYEYADAMLEARKS